MHLVGSLREALLLPLTAVARGYNSKTALQRTAHPSQSGRRHFTILHHTQQLLKEKQGKPT